MGALFPRPRRGLSFRRGDSDIEPVSTWTRLSISQLCEERICGRNRGTFGSKRRQGRSVSTRGYNCQTLRNVNRLFQYTELVCDSGLSA